MTKFYRFRFGLVLLSALLLLAIFSCTEQPYNRRLDNLAPDTFIGDVALVPVGAASMEYTVTVQFSGLDSDSRLTGFEYRWDDGEWEEIEANVTSISEVLEFPEEATSYDFEVRAIDEEGAVDGSPAETTITGDMAVNSLPSISVTGPPAGAEISPYTIFSLQGSDAIGAIDHLEYKLDKDGEWKTVYPDPEDYSVDVELFGMPEGFHTFYAKAIDNWGAESSIATSTFYVVEDYFDPYITASPAEGPLFLYPVGGPGDWPQIQVNADPSYYYGGVAFYQYSLDGGTTWTDLAQEPLDFVWDTFDRSSSSISFMYRVYDKSGHMSEGSLTWSPVDVEPIVGDKKILLVDGITYNTYSGLMGPKWTISAFNAGRDFIYFGGHPDITSISQVTNFPTAEGTDLAFGDEVPYPLMNMFDVIIWLWNEYGGDETTYANSIGSVVDWLEDDVDHKFIFSGRYAEDALNSSGSALADFIGVDTGDLASGSITDLVATTEGAAIGMTGGLGHISYGSASLGISDWDGFTGGSSDFVQYLTKSDDGSVCGWGYGPGGNVQVVILGWRLYDIGDDVCFNIYDSLLGMWGY